MSIANLKLGRFNGIHRGHVLDPLNILAMMCREGRFQFKSRRRDEHIYRAIHRGDEQPSEYPFYERR